MTLEWGFFFTWAVILIQGYWIERSLRAIARNTFVLRLLAELAQEKDPDKRDLLMSRIKFADK